MRSLSGNEPQVSKRLEALFNPGSVAIIGCSGDLNRLSGRPLKFLLKNNFQGAIYPVNPKYGEINGLTCYPSIVQIPEPVDVALLIVPVGLIEGAVKDCIRANTKTAIIFSSGFAELGADGKAVQNRIARLSEESGMPILGPNCLGLINISESVPLSFSSALDEDKILPGPTALVSQSGAIAAYILGTARESGIGFSHWVTTGNEVSLDSFVVAQHLLAQNSVKGVMLYLEETRDSAAMMAAGRISRDTGKPLVCLKVGRSTSGRRAALSHTGALSGSDAEYDAALKKAGIIRAGHIEELLDLGMVLSCSPKPTGNRVAIMSISGGGGILCADRCEDLGLEVPVLCQETQEELQKVIPRFGSAKNPVDLTAELVASPGMLGKSLDIVLNDKDIDSVILFLGGNRKNGEKLSHDIVRILDSNGNAAKKPVIVSWMAAPDEAVNILREKEIPLLFDGVRAVNALGKLYEGRDAAHSEYDRRDSEAEDAESVKATLYKLADYGSGGDGTISLSESVSKKLIAKCGVPIPDGGLAETVDQAVQIANQAGFSVVAKVDSADILHKSDAGVVQVGIKDEKALRNAFDQLMNNAKEHCPQANIRGLLVERMVEDALEMIVGLKWSDKFGPMVMVGMGGVFVELLKDVSLRMAPVNREEAREMVTTLKTSRLLSGFRGEPERDVDALLDVIVKVSEIGANLGPDLVELDINPMFVLSKGEGVVAGDALIILKKEDVC
ncbi:acyl-CoA synthetase [Desulfosarcina alkanivorans]|uniref:Acyl-CoA synthetase n=1 Tax=Desulfosarcina alkanivorans TaxID=571177 RepID=A0A5K7YJK2_9BACT|nr:acetate--CoA ligase family protein [Desulfosarcina alkanivorans]BBO69852.1 acyl-CoA synthetase [Desulfosarcina alkanivorans]